MTSCLAESVRRLDAVHGGEHTLFKVQPQHEAGNIIFSSPASPIPLN